jgi:hypothetical protein
MTDVFAPFAAVSIEITPTGGVFTRFVAAHLVTGKGTIGTAVAADAVVGIDHALAPEHVASRD